MKVLIRCRHKEHLRPRAHIWINGDTLCGMLSGGGMRREKYMLIERTNDLTICKMCSRKEDQIWKFLEGGSYDDLLSSFADASKGIPSKGNTA